jgi:hypothetical protein
MSDLLTWMFLKSFRYEYTFVVRVVEEEAVINIVSEYIEECAVNIT